MAKGCEKASVKILGKSAVIRTEKGGKALVRASDLCALAKRLNLCLENYECL